MHTTPDGQHRAERPKARHGSPSEITWDGGAGRQPYTNQEQAGTPANGAADEVPGGNRGAHSGQTVGQVEQTLGIP